MQNNLNMSQSSAIPTEDCEGIYIDYEKGLVFLTIINPDTGKLESICPKIFVTNEKEIACIRIMETGGFYYMGITDDEGNIPEEINKVFQCNGHNTKLHKKYPPHKNCKMIFIKIEGMAESTDTYDDVQTMIHGTQEEVKTKVRVLCNSGITYGNPITRKPIKQYRMLKNYY